MPRQKPETKWGRVGELSKLPHKILEAAAKVGVDEREKERSASYMHIDHSAVVSKVNERFRGR